MDWILPAAVIGLIVLWAISRGKHYDRIFAHEHFVEFAERLVPVKAAAQERVGGPMPEMELAPMDPRTLQTSADLALFYTIDEVDNVFSHHYSISLAGTYTAGAVGETFTAYTAFLLGIPFEKMSVARSERPVFHTVFRLTPEEQAAFVSRAIEIPTLDAVPGIHAQLQGWRDRLYGRDVQPEAPEGKEEGALRRTTPMDGE